MQARLPNIKELKKIKAGERTTISTLYMDNYEFICMIARNYCRRELLRGNLWEDMAQECYLYFPKFKFSSTPAFIRSIRDVCCYVRWGGERVYHQVRQGHTEILTILDEPTGEYRRGGLRDTLGETLESDFDIMREIEPPRSYSEEVRELVNTYLTAHQSDIFEYFYYTDMTAREIGAIFNLNINGAQSLKTSIFHKLRAHREEIREKLRLIGLNEQGQEIASAI